MKEIWIKDWDMNTYIGTQKSDDYPELTNYDISEKYRKCEECKKNNFGQI